MQTELVKLKLKKKKLESREANKIKESFIRSCLELNVSVFEPLIEEDQYFQDLDKYRFLASLKEEFSSWREKGFINTNLVEGKCNGCHIGHKTYQFYTNELTPAFSYIIHEELDTIVDIFMCNLSNGMEIIDIRKLKKMNK